MHGVVRTRQFERAFRKLKKSGILTLQLREEIDEVIYILASRKSLATHYRDHQLTGDQSAYRECHIRGDLLLVYQVIDEKLILVLAGLGSHSQLFG